jgi:hypothetical protein
MIWGKQEPEVIFTPGSLFPLDKCKNYVTCRVLYDIIKYGVIKCYSAPGRSL